MPEQIEINTSPSAIGRNDQRQLNKQFDFNPKLCGSEGRNTQCSEKTTNHEQLRMQSTLDCILKKKILRMSRCECDQEITVA